MDIRKKLTICICTYNEKDNIKDCIRAVRKNGIENILVIDAGTDNTRELAEKEGAVVFACEKGLARQRQKAIDICKTEYLAFVDADDRLHSKCLSTLLYEMKKYGYDAIQASVRVYSPHTYWEKAIDATWRYCIFKAGPTNMIGRPAVYRTAAIKDVGADLAFVNIGDEDTAISIRMEKKGYKQGIGSGISYRKCPATWYENKNAWIKYGKGDAMVVKQYPQKKKAIYKHLLINYPLCRSLGLIKNGKLKYCMYPVLMGWFRYSTLRKNL